MTTGIDLASMNIQGTAQTPQQQTRTTQKPTAQELEEAGRQLREAFQGNAAQQAMAARAKALEAARAAATFSQDADATPAVVATPPIPSREFRIRGPNGEQTVIQVPPRPFDNTIPPQAVDLAVAFFITVAVIIIGLPLARAFARRMDRRGAAQIPPEVSSQLAHLNQAVDAIALEVERISEGQRFTTRLLSEQRESAQQTLPSAVNR